MNKPNRTEPTYDKRVLRALRRIIQGIEMYSKKLSSHYKITGPQLICLLTIRDHQPLTSSQISKEVHLSPSTIVGVLDRLEEKGFIERERDKKDRRRVYVTLTSAGERLAEQAPSPLQDKLASALGGLSELEQSTIALALEKVVTLMDEGQLSES